MKILKRILLALLLLIGIAVALVYVYKDTLIKRFVDNYNKNLNITIAYDDIGLSLFKKFPHANLSIDNLSIVHDDLKDTLFVSDKVYLAMNIEDLFKKSNEKIIINDLLIDKAKLNLLINKEGKATFDIKNLNKSTNNSVTTNTDENKEFVIDINRYELLNSTIIYNDKKTGILIDLENVNHYGKGDFSSKLLDLDTKTTVQKMTVGVGKVKYFNNAKVNLDAILGMDLENLKFTFKKNSAKINDLALVFDGFIDVNDNNQIYDITFNAPKANFKNVLSLIPSAYSSNFSGVSANGIANVNGMFKGVLSDKEFPKYNIHINTKNASFKYPDLPKSVTDIDFNGAIVSNTSHNNVFLDIKNLKFTIDKDTFETSGKITKLSSNPTVDAKFKGTLDLENLTKAYPIKLDQELKGVLKANFTTKADQKSVQENNYENIKTNGTASLNDFSYAGDDVSNPVYIKNASVKFNTSSILLTDFNAKTGKSDIQASGKLDNLFAFVFDNKDLKGNFNVNSNNFVVSDFLVEDKQTAKNTQETTKDQTTTEALKIPNFLDITTKVNAKRVVYDNIELKNLSGLMKLKDQKAILTNTKATMLDGQVVFNGDVNTKPNPATFDLDMNVSKFDIANSFNTLETFQKLVPVAKALKGKYNTSFKLKGNLDEAFSPEMNSLSGNAFAQLFVNNIDNTAIPLINSLASNLKFIDFSKVDLSKLKTALSFKNGRVTVKPFDLKYQDMILHISGSHGFDKSLKYSLKMDVPAKYLGTEAVNLLSKLTNIDKDTIMIPLSTMIDGNMLKPIVKVNFKSAINDLTVKVLEYQKQELTNQATSQVTDAINDVLTNNGLDSIIKLPKDSTNNVINDVINGGVNDVLDGLFGGKKKKKKK
jgi:hypothetical protein